VPSPEAFILPIRELIAPIPDDRRASLLADLSHIPTDIDGRRNIEWKRGNIWFHSIQDTTIAAMKTNRNKPYNLGIHQACFVKDLDLYIPELPEEEAAMRELFQTIFEVGTSDYWDQNPELPARLNEAYWDVSNQVINIF